MIRSNSNVTMRELAEVCGITKGGIKYHINNLKKTGLIKRIGPNKGGYWEIVKK